MLGHIKSLPYEGSQYGRGGMARSILIINPNSTRAMTEGLERLVSSSSVQPQIQYSFFTAPSGPPSINDNEGAAESTKYCTPHLKDEVLAKHDAFVVACYSKHPLVEWLRMQDLVQSESKPVLGIFEASVATSLELIGRGESYGIVSTGEVWEKALREGTASLPIDGAIEHLAGVETTGLNATELHDNPQQVVQAKLRDATARLLRRGNVGAICLGCAGMAGMDLTIRRACQEELGAGKGDMVYIVDGVIAAVELIARNWQHGCI